MKKLLIIALIAFSMTAKAQITFEHTYPNLTSGFLKPINIGPSGKKYAIIDTAQIQLYNLNHSLFRSITFPITTKSNGGNVILITENLFDNDSTNIEYLINDYNYTGSVKIFREDGTLLFDEPNAWAFYPIVILTNPIAPFWTPILMTDSGAKMILYKNDGSFKIYGLPGIIPSCCCGEGSNYTGNYMNQENSFNYEIRNYPNPSLEQTTIEYNLPKGINQGEIVFYNLHGVEIKRFKVDNTFNSLIISTSDIAAGTYYYQLQTTGQSSAGKKMVVIK